MGIWFTSNYLVMTMPVNGEFVLRHTEKPFDIIFVRKLLFFLSKYTTTLDKEKAIVGQKFYICVTRIILKNCISMFIFIIICILIGKGTKKLSKHHKCLDLKKWLSDNQLL